MNKFDYDEDFDLSDYNPNITPQVKSNNKIDKNKKNEDEDFDLSLYQPISENNEQGWGEYFNYMFNPSAPISNELKKEQENDRLYQKFKAPVYTEKQIQEMTPEEKSAYKKQVKREKEYLYTSGVSKSLLSAATLGYSENWGEDFKVREYETGKPFGYAVGATPLIMGASYLAGYPVAAAAEYATLPKSLQYLAHAFGTGAIYESGQQAVNKLNDKEVDLTQIPKRGAEFAAFTSLINGAGALGRRFMKLSPSAQSSVLQNGVIPENLPKSQYETAEEMLKLIQQQQTKNTFPRPGPPDGPGNPPSNPPSRINSNRITNPQDVGLRPASNPQNPTISDEIGNIFSRNRFYNTTQGGQGLQNEIRAIDNHIYEDVNNLYARSRELNSAINDIQPELVENLSNVIEQLREIPSPSRIQRSVITEANNIRRRLAEFNENGDITGYLPINNQALIDQVQSLRHLIDYDFAHGNSKNIFRPLINYVQDAALSTAENFGNAEAAEAINAARQGYRTWVQAFDNDYIRPFRDKSNQSYSKLFKDSLNTDNLNVVRNILNMTPRGQELSNGLIREHVENNLSKYFENPRSSNSPEFIKTLRELESVVTPEQAQQIKNSFQQRSKKLDVRARAIPKRQPTNDEVIAARYQNSKPEDIQNMMNSRSGIKQLRNDFSDTPQKSQVFERLKQQKMRSILREGNIEKDFKGDELYRFLNNEKNYELFSEMIGESETEILRQTAKDIGKTQVRSELRRKGISQAANKVAAYKILETVLSLL